MKKLLFLLWVLIFVSCPPPNEPEVIKAERVDVSPTSLELGIGIKATATAKVIPEKASQEIVWSSENNAIAVVDQDGVITGVSAGDVNIRAASKDLPSVFATIAVKVSETDFNYGWSYEGDSLKLTFKGLATFANKLEVAPKQITIEKTVNETVTKIKEKEAISDEIVIDFGKPSDITTAGLSFLFFDAEGKDCTSSVTNLPDFSNLTIKHASVELTPNDVNIIRKTGIKGELSTKAQVSFSYPDMEVLMNEKWGITGSYNWNKSFWTGTLAAGSKTVSIPTNTPYNKPFEFELDLTENYDCSLPNAALLIAGTSADFVGVFSCTWSKTGHSLFGQKITLKKEREFPEYIWLQDNLTQSSEGNINPAYSEKEVEGWTKYRLEWADDFNYAFNGLNYKNNTDYLNARENENDPASDYARLWGCENLEQGSHPRKWGTWDFRTIEAKNGNLLVKHMGADPVNQTFYLGNNKTKPLKGFTDISNTGDPKQGGFVPGFISGGAITNKLYEKGYYVGKLRTRYKGYAQTPNTTTVGDGAWFAFWLHGDMHEFDLMEQTAGLPRVINYVNQYHNGWGTYGKIKMSYYYTKLTVGGANNGQNDDIQNNWWKLALRWTNDKVVYYYNDEWAHYVKKTNDANTTAEFTTNSIRFGTQATQATQNDLKKVDTSHEDFKTSYSKYGYNGHMLAIPNAPMNVFLSTEIGNGWGGTPSSNEISKLPIWTEAEYIAYYVPATE